MRALGVVMMPPPFDEHLGFLQGHEDLRVEQFVTKFAVEALVVAVLPGATGLDVKGCGADLAQPVTNAVAMNSGPLSERI